MQRPFIALIALLTLITTLGAAEPRINVSVGGLATTTWDMATEYEDFTYGGQASLSVENVFNSPFEIGVRQAVWAVDVPTSATTTTYVDGEPVTVTETYTKPNAPNGHGYGWYRNYQRTVTYEVPGEPTPRTTTVYNEDQKWFGATSAYVGINAPICKLVTLYAGGSTTVEYGQGIAPVYYAGPEGGLKVNVTENVYGFGRVNYDFRISDRVGNEGDLLRYSAGIGFRF